MAYRISVVSVYALKRFFRSQGMAAATANRKQQL